ncbi:M50 family metallopeptidase [Bacillus piscicola]|uniref:M50 family metallopeptidase n=1 Tax=Bacillus piscicola TaxID=1632684 RepID=UPI001F09DCA0|nr:M50 family metallopeptidase [Bacillus piscicola]
MNKQRSVVHIHPLLWVTAGIAVFTGFFYDLLLLFLIVLLHELGHAAAALHFKWRIKKIELLPFGGVLETPEYGRRPLREEVIVAAAGPLVHLPLMLLSYLLLAASVWKQADHQLFMHYNLTLLCFNLLPVWPLDGGKILYCWFCSRVPYYFAQKIMWITSCLFLCGLMFLTLFLFPAHLQAWIIMLFFIVAHYTEWKQQPYSFFQFLLERTQQKHKKNMEPVLKIISMYERPLDVAKQIHKNKRAAFYIKENRQTLPESYILDTIINKRAGLVPLNDLLKKDKTDMYANRK